MAGQKHFYSQRAIGVSALRFALLLLLVQSCCDDPVPGIVPQTITDAKSLSISPVAQQTPVWCWAAVAEMVLRYYGLPNLNPGQNYQCGIVAVYYGPASPCWQNCFACESPIGPMANLQTIINQYGLAANNLGVPSKNLSGTLLFRGLSFEEVAAEIRSNRPILVGISPGGFAIPGVSQHFATIIGYDAISQPPSVIVNDPFPFGLPQFGGQQDPYIAQGGLQIQPGKYKIAFTTFSTNLVWANTIYLIQ